MKQRKMIDKELSWDVGTHFVDWHYRNNTLGKLRMGFPVSGGYNKHVDVVANLERMYGHIIEHLGARSLSEGEVESVFLTNRHPPLDSYFTVYADRIAAPSSLDITVLTGGHLAKNLNKTIGKKDSGVISHATEGLFRNKKLPLNLQFLDKPRFLDVFLGEGNQPSLDCYGIPIIGQTKHYNLLVSAGKVRSDMDIGYISKKDKGWSSAEGNFSLWVSLPANFGRLEREELSLGERSRKPTSHETPRKGQNKNLDILLRAFGLDKD